MAILGWTSFIYADQIWFWYTFTIIEHVAVLIVLALWIIHSINLTQDLLTTARKSVSWRVKKPVIDTFYKVMSVFAYLTLTIFVIAGIFLGLSSYSYFDGYCKELIVMTTDCYFTAKQFMYLLFLIKLYVVYDGSSFGYKSNNLLIIGSISVLLCSINCILTIFYNGIDLFYYDNIPFAMHCNAFYPLYQYFIFAVVDVFMALFFLYSFVNPIRLLLKDTKNSNPDEILIQLAVKSVILTLVALLSTLIFMLFMLFTNTLLLGSIDVVINFICVLLMTPYYNEKHYENICCILIKIGNKCVGLNEIENTLSTHNSANAALQKRKRVGSTHDSSNTKDSTLNPQSDNRFVII